MEQKRRRTGLKEGRGPRGDPRSTRPVGLACLFVLLYQTLRSNFHAEYQTFGMTHRSNGISVPFHCELHASLQQNVSAGPVKNECVAFFGSFAPFKPTQLKFRF